MLVTLDMSDCTLMASITYLVEHDGEIIMAGQTIGTEEIKSGDNIWIHPEGYSVDDLKEGDEKGEA